MANQLQEHFAELLLDRISRDAYPSGTQMDLLEAIAPPRIRLLFVMHLIERIESDIHPSIPMMERVQRLILSFGRS